MAFSDPGTGRAILDSGRGTEPEKVTLSTYGALPDPFPASPDLRYDASAVVLRVKSLD